MRIHERIAEALWQLGVKTILGAAGSGNYLVTNGIIYSGATGVGVRDKSGAPTLADWPKLSKMTWIHWYSKVACQLNSRWAGRLSTRHEI